MADDHNDRAHQEGGDAPPLTDFRFGAVAVWGGLVQAEALEEALGEQAGRRSRGESAPRIGEMLLERGPLTEDEVRRVLRVQLQRRPYADPQGGAAVPQPRRGIRRLWEALRARLSAAAQAGGGLGAPRNLAQRPFGPIAVARRFATGEAVSRALDKQSREILAGAEVRHLGDILAAAGAIRPEEVEAILAYQADGDTFPMTEARRKGEPLGSHRSITSGSAQRRAPPISIAEQPETGGPSRDAVVTVASSGSSPQGEAPGARDRPVFLPRGALGFLLDNSIWIIAALAAAFAAALAVFREAIF